MGGSFFGGLLLQQLIKLNSTIVAESYEVLGSLLLAARLC